MLKKTCLLIIASTLLSGCVNHYRYESRGSVTNAEGHDSAALLYWEADHGHLWYGKKYSQVDSAAVLIVCGSTPSIFDPADSGSGLILKSRSGDRQLLAKNSSGQLQPLPEPLPLAVNSSCGTVEVDGKAITTTELSEKSKPEIAILCDNLTRPGRYAKPGQHIFGAIVKTKAKSEEGPPDYCGSYAE